MEIFGAVVVSNFQISKIATIVILSFVIEKQWHSEFNGSKQIYEQHTVYDVQFSESRH